MKAFFLPLLLIALPAMAQDQAIQRELIQRQQQSDAFNLQLRQSLERSAMPAGDHMKRMELETRHLGQRQHLQSVSDRQLRESPPQEPIRAAQERQSIVVPVSTMPIEVRVKPVAPPTLVE